MWYGVIQAAGQPSLSTSGGSAAGLDQGRTNAFSDPTNHPRIRVPSPAPRLEPHPHCKRLDQRNRYVCLLHTAVSHGRWLRLSARICVLGQKQAGTAAVASASPSSKASRRRRPRPRISRAGTSASGVGMPNPIRVVTAPNSGAPRANQTRPGGQPAHQRETCMRLHGPLTGNPQVGQAGDSQPLQLPAAARQHRPSHGADGSLELTMADAPASSLGSRSALHSP